MRIAILSRSNRPSKKFMVRVGNRTIHFGASGYEDYTVHKDPKRKARYLARHKNENRNDPESGGFWARWVLWNKPTLAESIKDISKLCVTVTLQSTNR